MSKASAVADSIGVISDSVSQALRVLFKGFPARVEPSYRVARKGGSGKGGVKEIKSGSLRTNGGSTAPTISQTGGWQVWFSGGNPIELENGILKALGRAMVRIRDGKVSGPVSDETTADVKLAWYGDAEKNISPIKPANFSNAATVLIDSSKKVKRPSALRQFEVTAGVSQFTVYFKRTDESGPVALETFLKSIGGTAIEVTGKASQKESKQAAA